MADGFDVAILMGSKSDWPVMKRAAETLDELGVSHAARVLSAHRTPEQTAEFVRQSEADGTTPAGFKDSLDGAYVANEVIAGMPANAYLDELEGYDMLGFDFLEMMEAEAFTDPLTSTAYDSYYEYLSGSSDGTGVSALDISFFATHGGSKGNVSLNRTSTLWDPAESFAQQLETRYDLLVDNAFLFSEPGTLLDVYIEQVDGSWGEQNHFGAGSAPAATPGVDVTGVIGIVKEVPAGGGATNPFPLGYVHGFIWIPPDITVDAYPCARGHWRYAERMRTRAA